MRGNEGPYGFYCSRAAVGVAFSNSAFRFVSLTHAGNKVAGMVMVPFKVADAVLTACKSATPAALPASTPSFETGEGGEASASEASAVSDVPSFDFVEIEIIYQHQFFF